MDLDEMNQEAIRLGMVTPQQVCAHLEKFIVRSQNYRARRSRPGRVLTAYDEQVAMDMCLAARIIWLFQQKEEESK